MLKQPNYFWHIFHVDFSGRQRVADCSTPQKQETPHIHGGGMWTGENLVDDVLCCNSILIRFTWKMMVLFEHVCTAEVDSVRCTETACKIKLFMFWFLAWSAACTAPSHTHTNTHTVRRREYVINMSVIVADCLICRCIDRPRSNFTSDATLREWESTNTRRFGLRSVKWSLVCCYLRDIRHGVITIFSHFNISLISAFDFFFLRLCSVCDCAFYEICSFVLRIK